MILRVAGSIRIVEIAPSMARLHEYQGKAILAANGFKIPRSRAASTADDAVAAGKELTRKKGGEVVEAPQCTTV
jgi:succinyl-CoA synthetase beta subunit